MKKFAIITTLLIGLSQTAISYGQDQVEVITDAQTDICTVKGMFYTVQLGVFSNPIAEEAFGEHANPVYCIKRKDGRYAYFAGIYDSRFDAMRKRYQIAKSGGYESYVAVYYNGEQISIAEADNLLEKNGEVILYNAEETELYTEKKDQ